MNIGPFHPRPTSRSCGIFSFILGFLLGVLKEFPIPPVAIFIIFLGGFLIYTIWIKSWDLKKLSRKNIFIELSSIGGFLGGISIANLIGSLLLKI